MLGACSNPKLSANALLDPPKRRRKISVTSFYSLLGTIQQLLKSSAWHWLKRRSACVFRGRTLSGRTRLGRLRALPDRGEASGEASRCPLAGILGCGRLVAKTTGPWPRSLPTSRLVPTVATQSSAPSTGAVPEDPVALMTAVLADATNLRLARMARSSGMFSHTRLLWTAEWHLRDETYQAALACLVDAIRAQPFTALWGEGDTSSSDGQFFKAGGHGEARADHNHYGSEPGIKFYTHVSDRFAPFYTKVIAANASEAAHVLDGLLHHESSLVIREHYTDTGGATEHVFGLCHLLGFRFVPRLRDLADRRLFVAEGHADHGALDSLIGGVINLCRIERKLGRDSPHGGLDQGWNGRPFGASAPAGCLSPAERSGQGAARDRLSRADSVHPRLDLRSGAQTPFQRWAQ